MMKIHSIASTFVFLAGLSTPTTGHAASLWNATSDFTASTSSNPNGVWSYGYDPANVPGYNFKAFDSLSGSPNPLWLDSTFHSLNTPAFWKNLGATPLNGVLPGQISLHPGPAAPSANNNSSILRFNAPDSSAYEVNAQFFAGDVGETVAWVVKNGDLSTPLSFLGSTTSNPVFSIYGLPLAAGDTLDFVVGNSGSHSWDNTPLTVSIVAVPLPASIWLLGTWLLSLLGAFRRMPAR